MSDAEALRGLRTFALVWLGQLASLLGTGLSSFAIAVWLYERTGSVTQLGLVSLAASLPAIALAPVAGALVDRWRRRSAMILSESVGALSALVIALLLLSGRLTLWPLCLALTVASAFKAPQWPAFAAATTLMVPKQHLGRASGLSQLAQALGTLVSPLLAGMLLAVTDLFRLLLLHFAAALVALLTLLVARFPEPREPATDRPGASGLLRGALFGWDYIADRPGFLDLLAFVAVINFVMSMARVLLTPLVLSFASPQILGIVLSIGGMGMLAGSVAMGVWGGPRRRVLGILGVGLLLGLSLTLAALRPSAPLIAGGLFAVLFGMPIIIGCSQALWQSKTPPEVQGRVFGVRLLLTQSTIPLGFLLAGPLADDVFEPLLAAGGPLSSNVGRLIGVGPGRGAALLLSGLGLLTVAASLAAFLSPRLRLLEKEIGDALPSETLSPRDGSGTALALAKNGGRTC